MRDLRRQMTRRNRTSEGITGVYESRSSRFIRRAVWEISRQDLPKVFNNLFTTCQERLRIEGHHFQHLL